MSRTKLLGIFHADYENELSFIPLCFSSRDIEQIVRSGPKKVHIIIEAILFNDHSVDRPFHTLWMVTTLIFVVLS